MAPSLDGDYGFSVRPRRGGGGGGKRLSFEDALAYLPTLQELASDRTKVLEKADKDHLKNLVKVTLGWENSWTNRTWKEAETDAHLVGTGYTSDSLRKAMREVLELFTLVLAVRLQEDPSWAASSLSVLVDNTANLYDNRVSSYGGGGGTIWSAGGGHSGGTGGGGTYMTQEGATFLKGVAAAAFAREGGLDMLAAAMKGCSAEPKTILALVELANGLMWAKLKPEEDAALGACLGSAGEELLQVPEKVLVERREEVQKSLKLLLSNTRAIGGAAKPPSRPAIEAAWQRFIVAGLRSTNLQARRGAADTLADAKRYGISARELAPWLAKESILEELFGDRLDPRVLEELSLEPLCEPSAEGLRGLLAGLERSLTHAVLYKKLHELVTVAPESDPPAWGRDLAVMEIMRWVRGLVLAGRADAVGLVAGLFTESSMSFVPGDKSHSYKRVFAFVGAEAMAEATDTLVAAILADCVTDAQLVSLEAAFDDVRAQLTAPAVLSKLLQERISELEASVAEGGKPLSTAAVRLLFRVLQSYPISDIGVFTREGALAANPRLPDLMYQELSRFVAAEPAPSLAAMQWRLRALSFVHRSAPGSAMSAARLQELVALIRPLEAGAHVWYFLRIASTCLGTGAKDVTSPALSAEAVDASLTILEEWAKAENFSMPAFFCLQQAIALVNGQEGRLRFVDKDGDPMSADTFAMGCVEHEDESQCKGPNLQLVGTWVMVLQVDGNNKLARMGRFDEVTEQFSIEYIDEMIHRRKIATLAKIFSVLPLEEQAPTKMKVEAVADPTAIKGSDGLWSCALGSGAKADVAQKATDMLLSLHQGSDGTRALLGKLLSRMSNDAPPSTLGRGLMLLDTMTKQQPLSSRREHIGIGFPYRMRLIEYTYVWEEVVKTKAWWESSTTTSSTKEQVRRRKQASSQEIWVHSQMTLSELHALASATLGKRNIELFVRGADGTINAQGQETLQERRMGFGRVLEAEAGNMGGRIASAVFDGPLDDLGDGDAAWLERLLDLLTTCSSLDSDNRHLCWQLLMKLPTHAGLAGQVREPEGKPWPELLSHKKPWHSAYVLLLIDAFMSPLYENSTGSSDEDLPTRAADAERWFSTFAKAGGIEALVGFFVEFMSARPSDSSPSKDMVFELKAVLPPLVRTIGASIVSSDGGKEVLGADGGAALVRSATQATMWLFESSRNKDEEAAGGWWARMQLRYTAGAGLDLLVAAQKRAELALETVDSLVLPLLLAVAQEVEGHVNSRVVAAIVEVSRRPGATPMLLRRLAAAVPKVAASAGDGSVPFFDIALEALTALGEQIAKEAESEREEMTSVVCKAVLGSRSHVPSLYRLLKALLKAGAGSSRQSQLVAESGGPMAEHMVRCVLPEQSRGLDDDHTREQAAEALLYLLDAGDWELRSTVLRKVNGYIAETPTPETYDFEPKAPKEPSTSLEGRRNETGHVGLINRGMTCYMNSTVQQLFWSLPFRNAVLSAPPPVADMSEKPEPLPDPSKPKPEKKDKPLLRHGSTGGLTDGKDGPPTFWSFLQEPVEVDDGPKKTVADVGWQLQRMFAYLQDCQLGQFNTDQFVKACSCLNLEYAVTSQNDAAEFFDKLCDAADTMYAGSGDVVQKPANIFLAKTCREKYCHNCSARTKGREDEMKRVQLSALCETLEECLDELCAAETMSGDNRVDCDHCGPKRDTTYRTYFTQLPQILVLNLARITFDLETLERVKKNPRIAFPPKLNVSKYTEDAVVNGIEFVPGCSYELQGVQIHQGGASSGHYYSFAQDVTGGWYKFNDDRVGPFDTDNLDTECFGGEDYDKAGRSGRKFEKSYNAYMLYYRCVDAAPWQRKRAEAEKPAAPEGAEGPDQEAPSLIRATSEQVSPTVGSLGKAPMLSRNITHAFSGQRLVDRQKRRRQAQMKADLHEEIESTNIRLHRQAVMFSDTTAKFLQGLIGKLHTEMGMAATAAGAPLAAAKVLSVKSGVAEALCRLSCKVLFDVLIHAQGCTARSLQTWVDLIKPQFALEGADTPQWLLARLAGEVDQVLGRNPSSWLPKILFECKEFDERFPPVASVVAAAAENAVATGAAASCGSYLEAMLTLMGSVTNARQLARYGVLWEQMMASPALAAFVAAHRGIHGSSVSTLLVHLYIGEGSTPLPAPPAPALSNIFITKTKTQDAYAPLLRAVASLLQADPKLAGEPIFSNIAFWRALAKQNPEVLGEGEMRKLMPQDFEVLKVIAQTIVEALRPSGAEDLVLSASLRKALAYVLSSGGAEEQANRIFVLSEVGQQLMVTARSNSTRATTYSGLHGSSGTGGHTGGSSIYSSGGDGSLVTTRRTGGVTWGSSSVVSGPRNPEAIQFLRLLQVVAELCQELPESWAWAAEFITEVLERKNKARWQKDGLPMDEVAGLAAQFGLGGASGDTAGGSSASEEKIKVFGAGELEANGEYRFSHSDDDDCPHYENTADGAFHLYQEKNRYGDVRWLIEKEAMHGLMILYRTEYLYAYQVDSPFPPSGIGDWKKVRGDLPAPRTEAVLPM